MRSATGWGCQRPPQHPPLLEPPLLHQWPLWLLLNSAPLPPHRLLLYQLLLYRPQPLRLRPPLLWQLHPLLLYRLLCVHL